MDQQLKANLTSSKLWVRMLYMLFLALCIHIASFVVGVVVIIQFVITLLNGTNNLRLKKFGLSLVYYIKDGLTYLTFNGEFKPFPFADWPDVEIAEADSTTSAIDDDVDSVDLDESGEKDNELTEEPEIISEVVEQGSEPIEPVDEPLESSEDIENDRADDAGEAKTAINSDDSEQKDLNKQQKE